MIEKIMSETKRKTRKFNLFRVLVASLFEMEYIPKILIIEINDIVAA
jgi:hypothetical protein